MTIVVNTRTVLWILVLAVHQTYGAVTLELSTNEPEKNGNLVITATSNDTTVDWIKNGALPSLTSCIFSLVYCTITSTSNMVFAVNSTSTSITFTTLSYNANNGVYKAESDTGTSVSVEIAVSSPPQSVSWLNPPASTCPQTLNSVTLIAVIPCVYPADKIVVVFQLFEQNVSVENKSVTPFTDGNTGCASHEANLKATSSLNSDDYPNRKIQVLASVAHSLLKSKPAVVSSLTGTICFQGLGSSVNDTRTVFTEAVMNSKNVIMTDFSLDVLKTFEIARTFETVSDYFVYSSVFYSSQLSQLISYNVSAQFLSTALTGPSSLLFSNILAERPIITTLTILYRTIDIVLSSAAFESDLRTEENSAHFLKLTTDFSTISMLTAEMKYVTLESMSHLTYLSVGINSDIDISVMTTTERPSTPEVESSLTNVSYFVIMQSTITAEDIISNTKSNQIDILPSSRLLESSTLKLDMLLTIISSDPSTLLYENMFYRDSGLNNDIFTSAFVSVSPLSTVATSSEKNILSVSTNQIHFKLSLASNLSYLNPIYSQTVTQNTEETSFSSVTASSFLVIKSTEILNLQLTESESSLFVQPSFMLSNNIRTSSTDSGLFIDILTSEFAFVSYQLSTVATSEKKLISVSSNRESLRTDFEISLTSYPISVSSPINRQTIQTTEQTSFSSVTTSSLTVSPAVLNLHLTSSGSSLFLQPSFTFSTSFRSPSALYSDEDKSRLSLVIFMTETQHVTISSQVLLGTTTQPTTASASGLSPENIIIISSSVAGGLVTILIIILITLYIYNKLPRKQSNKNYYYHDMDKHGNVSDPNTFKASDYPNMYTGMPLRLKYISHIPYSYDYYCDYERNWNNP